jgi:tRNA dimethylallyltransferase
MTSDQAASELSFKSAEAVLIAGPTASGKSAFAIDLALRCDGVLINADSMQVYRDLQIVSARPSAEDEQRVPHFLFGHVDGAVNYSVGHWLEDVARLLPAIRKSRRLPIFVGGTGLYFKALTQGLSSIPRVPQAVRARLRAETEALSPGLLHERLAACDPVMAAKLRPSDPQRLLRALEVFMATGQSLATFQHQKSPPLLDAGTCEALFLAPDREQLRMRIEARFTAMLEQGALEEVRQLAARGLDASLPVVRAHGVPHLMRHLSGEIGLEEAARQAIAETRQYARRQFTFARHQLPAFRHVSV